MEYSSDSEQEDTFQYTPKEEYSHEISKVYKSSTLLSCYSKLKSAIILSQNVNIRHKLISVNILK